MADVADRLGELEVPVLLAWGSLDPVFNDDFAADLQRRLPNTVLHRFADANHLVMTETGTGETSVAAVAERFIASVIAPRRRSRPDSPRLRRDFGDPVLRNRDANVEFRALSAGVVERRDDRSIAFVDMATGDELRFDELAVQDRGDRRRPASTRTAGR